MPTGRDLAVALPTDHPDAVTEPSGPPYQQYLSPQERLTAEDRAHLLEQASRPRSHPPPRPGHGTVFVMPAWGGAEVWHASWQDDDNRLVDIEGSYQEVRDWVESQPAPAKLIFLGSLDRHVDVDAGAWEQALHGFDPRDHPRPPPLLSATSGGAATSGRTLSVKASKHHDELRTERLLLRHWRDDDREPFAAMNADPRVMRFVPAPLDRDGSDRLIDRRQAFLAKLGWGLWAVEVVETGEFIGFTGLSWEPFDMPASPCVEVGWRLAADHWGRGYAPEAARAALDVAFDDLALEEVVSFTTTENEPSRRVMTKLGLRHDPARDFDHPRHPDWPGRRTVLYAITQEQWRAGR